MAAAFPNTGRSGFQSMSVRRHNSSRSGSPRGSRGHGRRLRGRQRRFAIAALSPLTAIAVLLLAAVTLAVWSCSTDPGYPRRRPAPLPAAAGDAATPTLADPAPAPIVISPLFEAEPDIRVRVRQAVETVRIECPTPIEASVPEARPLVLVAPVIASSLPTGLRLTSGVGEAFDIGPGLDVTLVPIAASGSSPAQRPAAHLRIDGADFPGALTLRRASDTSPLAFDVIATMAIEDYLPGVLAKELFANWPLAAYEAQAVCARTYALFVRGLDRAAGRAFDVENSQADQVYGGATTNVTALRAVRNTRGVVLTYGGALFKTYYSSTCGGRAGSAADVWPISRGFEYNLAPPIQGAGRDHYCQAARLYRWEATRTADELGKRLAAWGRNAGHAVRSIGSVRGVSVEKVNQTSRPSRYSVIDDRGRTFSLSGEELRVACNFSAEGYPAITPQTRVNSNDLEFIQMPATELTFLVRGRGFGHGVGMCQWCLKGMADRGIPWDQQVLTFYPGAQIIRGYN